MHVPLPSPISPVYQEQLHDKKIAIRCIHILAVALKHHLRGERHWADCTELNDLLEILPDVNNYHTVEYISADLNTVQLRGN